MFWSKLPAPTSGGTTPPVIDHTSTPNGLVPRHLQTWVVVGIAVLMTGILALSGSTRPVGRTPAANPTLSAIQPNDTRIREYQRQVDAEAQRVAAARAELDAAKRELQTPTQSTGMEPDTVRATGAPDDNGITREKAERDYRALFADNVALSYRPREQTSAPAAPPTAPAGAAAHGSVPPTAPTPSTDTTTPAAGRAVPAPSNASASVAHQASDPRQYVVREGTIIEAVLTNRLDGSFAGPVNAMVTTDVYAADREHVLIPQGARLLGEAKAIASFGQERLAVAFHRLIQPDGDAVSLDHFVGLNQLGDTGLKDQVNHHYAQLFGVSLAIGAIGGLAQADTGVGFGATSTDLYRQGVAASTAQSSMQILDRFLNVLPTVTIREGQRLKVYLCGDLTLPAYGDVHE